MSTTAPHGLFAGWIDDAAVFPPGNAPLGAAWHAHRALRAGPYADLLGPLLIPTSAAPEVVALAQAEKLTRSLTPSTPVEVSVIARAGIPAAELVEAVSLLRACDGVPVVGAEIAHDPHDPDGLRQVLALGLSTAVELPRDATPATMFALADLAHRDGAAEVIAKLRTQAGAQAPPPSSEQVATFLIAAHRVGIPVKFTGGLHHALRHGEGDRAEHGCLNVLVAAASVREGLDGADHSFIVDVLEQRDPSPLIEVAASWTLAQVTGIRSAFRSFGCCGVLDPIEDLVDLGLISPDLSEEFDAAARPAR